MFRDEPENRWRLRGRKMTMRQSEVGWESRAVGVDLVFSLWPPLPLVSCAWYIQAFHSFAHSVSLLVK